MPPHLKIHNPGKLSSSWEKQGIKLSDILCEKLDSKQTEDMDYEYMMDPVPEYLIDRARDCGHKLFELKKIGRRDIEARRAHNKENFTFFLMRPFNFYFVYPLDPVEETF